MLPRLLFVWLAGLALGAASGVARAETSVAALEPAIERAAAEPSLTGLRAAIASEARHLGAELRDTITRAVARASREHGLPAFLIVALIAQESGFDPTAENGGALGLMQLRPFVARDYSARRGLRFEGEAALRDPARNIALAAGYLGELVARFEGIDLALAAYNKGPEAVRRDLLADREPGRRFVAEVMRRYQHYDARFGGI
jgi:soluble lytic murein transglycosylase-like protein